MISLNYYSNGAGPDKKAVPAKKPSSSERQAPHLGRRCFLQGFGAFAGAHDPVVDAPSGSVGVSGPHPAAWSSPFVTAFVLAE